MKHLIAIVFITLHCLGAEPATRPAEWWIYQKGTAFMVLEQQPPVFVTADGGVNHYRANKTRIWFTDSGSAFRYLLFRWPRMNLREFAIVSRGWTGLHPKPLPEPEPIPEPNEPAEPNEPVITPDLCWGTLPTSEVWHCDPNCHYIEGNPDVIWANPFNAIDLFAGKRPCAHCCGKE